MTLRYRLRTLLILFTLGPPAVWLGFQIPSLVQPIRAAVVVNLARPLKEPPMFRFTIRELALVTGVVAAGAGFRWMFGPAYDWRIRHRR